MPQTIRLVTRADDLGSFRSANRAILEVYRHGIVRNASLLAIGHELDDAIRLLSDVDGLCVGCHASITSEWENVRWSPCAPAARIPALLDAHGHLVRHPREAAEQGADPEQVLLEVAAQLARLRALGVEPEYLDTHMRFDLLPGVADALDDFCRRESLLYASRVPDLARLARPAGLGRAEAVVAALRDAEPGRYLLIGHPAWPDEEMAAVHLAGHEPGDIAAERDDERRMFSAPEVLAVVAERGIEPIRYVDV